MIKDAAIDGGKKFDWGRVSADYAKYRDIYPQVFYQKIFDLGLCKDGQRILDMGTGTGVLPRNLYPTVGNGSVRIFRRNRSRRQNGCPSGWTLTMKRLRQKT